jgi:hypothetical protein
MNEMWIYLNELFNTEMVLKLLRALVLLVVGFIAAKLISRVSLQFVGKLFTPLTSQLIQRATYYLIFVLFVFSALL